MGRQSDLLVRIPKKPTYNGTGLGRREAPLPLITRTPAKEELDLKKYSKYEVPVNINEKSQGNFSSVVIYHIDGTEDLRSIIACEKILQVLLMDSS